MAKRKNHSNQQLVDPAQLAERLMGRGDYRKALKQARVADRKSKTAETKQLVVRASLGRVDELIGSGHVEQARDLLAPLANTVDDPSLENQISDLLLRTGLLGQFPRFETSISETDKQNFEIGQFDNAIVDLKHVQTPEIRQQVGVIHSALEAVEAGDHNGATEFLRGISRRSLAADWRYFVRGLMAWYENDHDAVAANWNRLDSDRVAASIVEKLTLGSDSTAGPSETDVNGVQSVSELNRFGVRAQATLPPFVVRAVPELRSIEALQELLLEIAHEDWHAVSKAFRECRAILRKNAPELFDRIARKVATRMIQAEDMDALANYCHRVDAPPHDPNWNRARATLSELCFIRVEEELSTVETRWLQCLHDIGRIDQFSDAEKQIARALVEARIGRLSLFELSNLHRCTCGDSHEEEIASLRERSIEFLENAIEVRPSCRDAWEHLVELHKTLDDSTALLAVRREMLVHFPDDLDVLIDAGESELEDGDPLQSRDYFVRAHRIKPLDDRLRAQVMLAHRECARTFIRGAEYDAARAELDAARTVDSGNELYHVNHDVLQAILELSAENDTAAEQCISDALSLYAEPTAANLDLSIEATGADLPDGIIQRFKKAWQAGLKRKCHSETAGHLARLVFRQIKLECPERMTFEEEVTKYIRRCSRVRFTSIDLRRVCFFLQLLEDRSLLGKHIEKGRKKFPDEPFFHLVAAEIEIHKGPVKCKPKLAMNAFRAVLELTEHSADVAHQSMAESARNGISMLENAGLNERMESPFFFDAAIDSDGPELPLELQDMMEEFVEEFAETYGMDADELRAKLEAKMSMHF